jgi:hypothetical protein
MIKAGEINTPEVIHSLAAKLGIWRSALCAASFFYGTALQVKLLSVGGIYLEAITGEN